MPRRTKTDPAYRKHTLRDFAFIQVDGKRIRLPGRFNSDESRAAYHAACAKLRSSRRHEVVQPTRDKDSLMLVELCEAFTDHCQELIGEQTRCDAANNRDAVRSFLPHHLDLLAAEFGPKRLKDYQSMLAATEKRKPKNAGDDWKPQTLSVAYVNSTISRIKVMFRWGVSEELVDPAVYHALLTVPELKPGKSRARESLKKQPVPMKDVTPVLDHLSPIVRAMVEFQVLTGVRSRSVCLAKPEQFDRTKQTWLWRPRHKTEAIGRELIVPIGPKCRKILRPFLQRAKPGEYLFRPRDVRKSLRYREHYDTESYYHAVTRGIVRANQKRKKGAASIPHWHPHRLRHTLGTLVHDRWGYEAAQAMLGHDSVNATKLYTARRLKLAIQIATEIG